MISKVLNYVWLSNDEKPEMINKCIKSWSKVLPEYEIREWSAKDFDFTQMPLFVREAYERRKWAFVTDYLRLYILYNNGGIYVDSDIFFKKSINEFLNNSFFSFVEYHENGFKQNQGLIDKDGNALTDGHIPGFCIQAAFMGAEKHHPFVKDCLDFYAERNFINEDGSLFTKMIASDIYGLIARNYGFKYIDEYQQLTDRMSIYPSKYCGGSLSEIDKENYAIHCCAGSWREYGVIKSFIKNIKSKIMQWAYLR